MDENRGPVGCVGHVTVATRGSAGPGEVVLRVKGGTEAYIAWSERPLAIGTDVLVWATRGGRVVDVMESREPSGGS